MRHLVGSVLVVAAFALATAACASGTADGPPSGLAPTSESPNDDPKEPPTTMRATAENPQTISYGTEPSQFGQLWLPAADKPTNLPAVVVLVHGGFWRSTYGLDLMDPLAADLVGRGYAVWNIEYRRVGESGGGWPGTLDDVAAAIDQLATMAADQPLDLDDVTIIGHSAGGHLALWAAGRTELAPGTPGEDPLVCPRLAIGQGPVVDLVAGDAAGLGGGAVTDFLGGSAAEHTDRYAVATPATTGPAELAVVRGTDDDIVPAPFTVPTPVGGIEVVDVDGADHFDLIDPSSTAWAAVIGLLERPRA